MIFPTRSILLRPAAIALIASVVSAAIALPVRAQATSPRQDPCVALLQADSTLSRAELRQFLQVPRGAARAEVTAVLGEPYCHLQSLEVELPDGTIATVERHAYPFEFAPQTWFVVFFSGDRYLTYDYSFPQSGQFPTAPEPEPTSAPQ